MVKQYGIPESRVVRILNGVDTGNFYPVPSKAKTMTRQRLGLPANKAIILYVGRLVPVKGLDVLLRAWALLTEDLRAYALLLVVGGGPEQEKLLDLIQTLGLQGSVLLAGEQEEVRDYYWAADVFVLPSRSEGLSVALLEAMASGLAVVVSDLPGNRAVVRSEENGLLFPVGDTDMLVESLERVMCDPNLRRSIGESAYRTIKNGGYSLQAVADSHERVYQEVLGCAGNRRVGLKTATLKREA